MLSDCNPMIDVASTVAESYDSPCKSTEHGYWVPADDSALGGRPRTAQGPKSRWQKTQYHTVNSVK